MVVLVTTLALAVRAGSPVTVTAGPIIDGLRPISLVAAPFGSRFAAAMEDGSVRIIDAKTRQTVKVLTKHPQPAYGLAWSYDGELVASGDETARIFVEDILTGKMVKQYRTHTKGIEKLSFNSTRQYLVSTGKDDFIKVYDLQSGKSKEMCSIAGHGLNFYGATCDPKIPFKIATGDLGQGGLIYDARTGKPSAFIVAQDNQGIYDLSFNPAGSRYVTAGRDANVCLWDAKTNKRICTMQGHKDWVMTTAFSPNGALVATGSTDGTVKVWNTYTMQKIADLDHQSAIGSPLCFTADGKTLVTVNDAGSLEYNSVSPAQIGVELTTASNKATKPSKKARHRRRRTRVS
jgi:WD40 repeat protein